LGRREGEKEERKREGGENVIIESDSKAIIFNPHRKRAARIYYFNPLRRSQKKQYEKTRALKNSDDLTRDFAIIPPPIISTTKLIIFVTSVGRWIFRVFRSR